MASGFIYALGVTTICLLMLGTWTGTSRERDAWQAGGFHRAEGTAVMDRRTLRDIC